MSATVRQRAILADFLQARREQLDLSPRQVAAACKRKTSWYRGIERAYRATIKLEELRLLERVLQLPTGELVRRAEEAGF